MTVGVCVFGVDKVQLKFYIFCTRALLLSLQRRQWYRYLYAHIYMYVYNKLPVQFVLFITSLEEWSTAAAPILRFSMSFLYSLQRFSSGSEKIPLMFFSGLDNAAASVILYTRQHIIGLLAPQLRFDTYVASLLWKIVYNLRPLTLFWGSVFNHCISFKGRVSTVYMYAIRSLLGFRRVILVLKRKPKKPLVFESNDIILLPL